MTIYVQRYDYDSSGELDGVGPHIEYGDANRTFGQIDKAKLYLGRQHAEGLAKEIGVGLDTDPTTEPNGGLRWTLIRVNGRSTVIRVICMFAGSGGRRIPSEAFS